MDKTRVEKTVNIADWKPAQENLQVCCWLDDKRTNNCGKCNKCVRTLITLQLIGKRSLFKTFPKDFNVRQIKRTPFIHDGARIFLKDIYDLAIRKDELDIARNIEVTLRRGYPLCLIKKHFFDNRVGRRVLGSDFVKKLYFRFINIHGR